MRKSLAIAALIGAFAAPSWANSFHGAPHDRAVLHGGAMAIGHPGDPALIGRTIRVSMRDAPDGAMTFDPAALEIAAGETVRIVLANDGAMPHEFVMATEAEIDGHREEMRGVADMPHDADFAARVEPGDQASLVWTFANAGSFAFACLIPGHYEAGMHGRLIVG